MTAISVSKERVDINSVSPEAYVYARNENSVVIQIASELIPGGMEFGYSINGNPSITAAGLSDDNQITIDNLDSNTDYQINLYHRYSGEEWGTLPWKAQSGVYTGSVTMELSAQSNMLIVSNIPSNADSIVLMNLTYGQQREKVAVPDTSCTFDFDVFDAVLREGGRDRERAGVAAGRHFVRPGFEGDGVGGERQPGERDEERALSKESLHHGGVSSW